MWQLVYYDDTHTIPEDTFKTKPEAEAFLKKRRREYRGGFHMKVIQIK